MHEDVPFNPRVRAVQIENIIRCPNKDIVEELHNRPGTISASEINDVIVANRHAKEVVEEDSLASGLDPAGAVHQFELRGRTWKNTVLDYERRAIQRHVLHCGIPECQVIEEKSSVTRMHGRGAIEIQVRIGDTRL